MVPLLINIIINIINIIIIIYLLFEWLSKGFFVFLNQYRMNAQIT